MSQWHHVVGVSYGNGSADLYIDGVRSANTTITNANLKTTSLSSNLTLGGNTGLGYFNGTLDEVMIFDRLSTDEVRALYNASTYQYDHTFRIITSGTYIIWGNANDKAGNRNEKEERFIIITFPTEGPGGCNHDNPL